jgi:hypothetical protein
VAAADKPLVWLHGEVKTPPFAMAARIEAGMLLRRLQRGDSLGMPHSVYRLDRDAIVIGAVFAKKTRTTPKDVIATCQRRFREYDDACK